MMEGLDTICRLFPRERTIPSTNMALWETCHGDNLGQSLHYITKVERALAATTTTYKSPALDVIQEAIKAIGKDVRVERAYIEDVGVD